MDWQYNITASSIPANNQELFRNASTHFLDYNIPNTITMFPQPATLLPLLLPLAAAAPAILDSRGLLNPAPFKLVANVTAFPITPNVTSYEAAFKPFTDKSCMGSVYLVPSGGDKWAQWTLSDNGTTYTTVNRDPSGNGDGRGSTGGIIVTPGGTSTVPSANTANVNACGVGSPGVGIVNNELLGWKDGWTGGCMACPVSLVPGSYGEDGDIVLSVKNEGQRTIYGCSNVDLRVVYV